MAAWLGLHSGDGPIAVALACLIGIITPAFAGLVDLEPVPGKLRPLGRSPMEAQPRGAKPETRRSTRSRNLIERPAPIATRKHGY